MNDELPENRTTLDALRNVLEPPRDLARKVVSAALRSDVRRRSFLPWAAIVGIGIVAVVIVLAVRHPSPSTAGVRIENVGSVVLARDDSGRSWLVANSRRVDRRRDAEKGMILMTKGEDR